MSKDANINVSLMEAENTGMLKMQHTNSGTITFSFYNEIKSDDPNVKVKKYSSSPQHIYQLNRYSNITIDPNDISNVTLVGGKSCPDLKIIFEKGSGAINFFEYIKCKVYLEQSESIPTKYIIRTQTDPSLERDIIPPYMVTLLPNVETEKALRKPSNAPADDENKLILERGEHKISKDDLINIKKRIKEITIPQNEKILNELSQSSLDSIESASNQVDENDVSKSKSITKADFDSFFEDGILNKTKFINSIYNKDIDMEIYADVLEVLIDICADTNQQSNDDLGTITRRSKDRKDVEEADFEKYKLLKRQWQNIPKSQFFNDTSFQNLVLSIEKDIKNRENIFSKFNDVKEIQKICFNILMTLAIYNYDNLYYFEGLLDFLVPFFYPFINQIIDENTILCHNGEKCEIDRAESRIFWCFYRFLDNGLLQTIKVNSTSDNKVRGILNDVGFNLLTHYKKLLIFFHEKQIVSLDCIRNDCAQWFRYSFPTDKVLKLWISALAFSDEISPFKFFTAFSVACLISVSPYLFEKSIVNTDQNSEKGEFTLHDPDIVKLLDLDSLLDETKVIAYISTTSRSIESLQL